MRQWQRCVLALWAMSSVSGWAEGGGGDILTLDRYLESVKSRNEGYQASQQSMQGAQKYQAEGQMMYYPGLFGGMEYADDGKPSPMPFFQYQAIVHKTYSLGVSQIIPGGLQSKFYYTLGGTGYRGQNINYDEGRPTLELTASLWRNLFGREVDAQSTALTAQHKARQFSEDFVQQTYLLKAESAYWRLALARQTQELARENLVRAEKLFQWAQRRVNLSLADRSDLLQASTVLQARKLELKSADDEARSAELSFNSARGVEEDKVAERLVPLSKELIGHIEAPKRKQDRADVLAAREQAKALGSQARLSEERNKGTFEIYGAYAFNSKESTMGDAFDKSWDSSRPTKMIGLRFSTAIAPSTASEIRSGWRHEADAAELNFRRRAFEQEQDWKDLAQRFGEAKARLESAEGLELAQKQKLDYERERHMRGRTTLFQVLTFESDYMQAQGIRLRTLAELLQIVAQMKLYGVNYESR